MYIFNGNHIRFSNFSAAYLLLTIYRLFLSSTLSVVIISHMPVLFRCISNLHLFRFPRIYKKTK